MTDHLTSNSLVSIHEAAAAGKKLREQHVASGAAWSFEDWLTIRYEGLLRRFEKACARVTELESASVPPNARLAEAEKLLRECLDELDFESANCELLAASIDIFLDGATSTKPATPAMTCPNCDTALPKGCSGLFKAEGASCWLNGIPAHAVETDERPAWDEAKCTCVYATAENSPSVRAGYELGGYVKEMCAYCKENG